MVKKLLVKFPTTSPYFYQTEKSLEYSLTEPLTTHLLKITRRNYKKLAVITLLLLILAVCRVQVTYELRCSLLRRPDWDLRGHEFESYQGLIFCFCHLLMVG